MSAPATHLPAPPQARDYGQRSIPQPWSLSLPCVLLCPHCDSPLTSQNGTWMALPPGRAQCFRQCVDERRRASQQQFGFPADALRHRRFLTDTDLGGLEIQFSIQWDIHCPWYGPRMAARPWRGKREPATFHTYSAKAAIR